MRAKQALRQCVLLLVACPLAAAVAQPQRCDTLPAFQREFARAIGACRDLAPIIDIAPPAVEATPAPALPVPNASTEAMQTTASPGGPSATKLAPQRAGVRNSTSKPTAASAKSNAPSKTAASGTSEVERRNEPPDELSWKTYQDNRYAFRHPARLVTSSNRNGVVELQSPDQEFRIRASARINSEKDTVEAAWQQRLKEHGQSVTYKRKGDGWFVLSGVKDGQTYYSKHFVSPERTAELVITYPKSRASLYDRWVTEIEKSFVAYRVSDGAQVSSSTNSVSVVTRAPAVNETLEVPNVIGRSYADAANGLTEFKVERVVVASAAPTGEVLAQHPASGSSLPPGSAIALRVSDGSLATAAAPVPASSTAAVAPASQLEPATAPVQDDRVAGASIGEIASNVVAPLVAGVLLGLLLAAVLMRRAFLARSRAIDTVPANHVDTVPDEIASSQASAEVHTAAAIEAPREIKFTARLDPGETTIEFSDLPEDEEAEIQYSRSQHA
jgi:PASTA domain